MADYKFAKEKLADLVAGLKDYRVFAPAYAADIVRFKEVADPAAVTLECGRSNVPPKELMFPETETLFRYRLGDTDIEPSVPSSDDRRVVFGIRPCDARAFSIVDNLFQWDFPDPYFTARRENTTLVGLACAHAYANCFCASLGGSPSSEEDVDAMMYDLGDTVYFKTITGKGDELAKALGDVLEAAGSAEVEAAGEQAAEALASLPRSIDTEGIPEKLPTLYDHTFWEQYSDRCLGCGICTFLCPTCHCFDIQDELEVFDGRRARMWDSCMFAEYTLHTSGHNPRPTRKERTRNRISHKYSVFPEKFGVIACVGCGRCISSCPVNIDILDVLEKSKQAESKEAKTA